LKNKQLILLLAIALLVSGCAKKSDSREDVVPTKKQVVNETYEIKKEKKSEEITTSGSLDKHSKELSTASSETISTKNSDEGSSEIDNLIPTPNSNEKLKETNYANEENQTTAGIQSTTMYIETTNLQVDNTTKAMATTKASESTTSIINVEKTEKETTLPTQEVTKATVKELTLEELRQAFIDGFNSQRTASGFSELDFNSLTTPRLSEACDNYAQWMADNKSAAHSDPFDVNGPIGCAMDITIGMGLNSKANEGTASCIALDYNGMFYQGVNMCKHVKACTTNTNIINIGLGMCEGVYTGPNGVDYRAVYICVAVSSRKD